MLLDTIKKWRIKRIEAKIEEIKIIRSGLINLNWQGKNQEAEALDRRLSREIIRLKTKLALLRPPGQN